MEKIRSQMQLRPQSLHWKCVLTSEGGRREKGERIRDSEPNAPLNWPRSTPIILQQGWSKFHFAVRKQELNLYQLQKHFPFLISFLIAIQGTVWFVSRPFILKVKNVTTGAEKPAPKKTPTFVDTQVCYCNSREKIMLSLYFLPDRQLKLGCWITWYMVQQ